VRCRADLRLSDDITISYYLQLVTLYHVDGGT
jgi:hypothetical protein